MYGGIEIIRQSGNFIKHVLTSADKDPIPSTRSSETNATKSERALFEVTDPDERGPGAKAILLCRMLNGHKSIVRD